jgi:hypothetical protein
VHIVSSFNEAQQHNVHFMEDAMRLFALLFVASSLVLLTGCDSVVDPEPLSPPPSIGTITGTVHLDPDIQGTIDGTIVQLYTSYDDAVVMHADRAVVVDQNGGFEFKDVYTGTYYIGLWKDNDRDGLMDSGDFTINRESREQCACYANAGCVTEVSPCISVVP